MPLTICPPGAAITDLSQVVCFQDFGEIRGLLYQRTYNGGVLNKFVIATNDPAALASMQAFLTAADSTKIVQAPEIENVVYSGGEARTVGGGAESLGGVPIVKGSTPTVVTARYNELPQWHIAELKTLQTEVLSVYLINEYGQLGGLGDKKDGTPITEFRGIPIAKRTKFVGDLKIGGYDGRDGNMVQFSHLPDWSDAFTIITPDDYDPRLWIPRV